MFKLVRPNENFRPSAEFHNATARLLNNLGHIGDGRFRGKRGGGGGESYAGPFALSWQGTNIYVQPGCIYAGLSRVFTNADTIFTESENSYWVQLLVTYSNGYSYSISKSQIGYPAQTASAYAVTLGYVDVSTQKIVQWQHGPIYIAGRIV